MTIFQITAIAAVASGALLFVGSLLAQGFGMSCLILVAFGCGAVAERGLGFFR